MATPLAQAFIRIRPDSSTFRRDAEREAGRAGAQAGEQFSESFGESARRNDTSTEAGRESGRRFGGAFTDSVKIAAGVAIAKIGEVAGQQLSDGFNQALDVSGARGKLQAQLGLTQQESARVGGVAGKLFANAYGDSMQDVQGAITSVIQNIDGMRGASSAALEGMTARAITTGQVLNEDVSTVTLGVSQIMRTGLAPNAKTAFDIITRGAQLGLNANGDLLDTFKEYGTQFRKLGIDGPQALGLIQQGLKGGARDADVVADAIKEFSIRAVDGSDSTSAGFKALGLNTKTLVSDLSAGGPRASKAFDLVLTKLRGIESPTKRAQVAVQLFGTQAEDLGDALFKLDPSSATKGIGDLAGATDKAGKAMGETAQAKFETFKRSLQTSVVNVIANDVIPAVEKLSGFLKDTEISGSSVAAVAVPLVGIGIAAKVASSAVGIMSTGINGIRRGVGAVTSTAQAAGRLAQGFRSAAVAESSFSGRAGTFGGKLRTAYTAAANGARSFATAAANGARAATTAAVAAGRAALAHTRAGAAAALSAVRTLAAAAAQRAIAIATRAWAIVQTAMNFILSANPIGLVVLAIGALIAIVILAYKRSETFKNIVDAAFRGIAAAGRFMWNTVLQPIFKAIMFFITKILIPYYRMWWNVAKLVFNGIATAGKFMWNNVLRPVFNAIRNFIVGILIVQFRVFQTVVRTVWNAIRTASNAAWGVLSGVFNRIRQAVGLVGTAFDRGAGAIRVAWAKIQGYTKTPINFVIGTVYNKGIVGLWNKVMSWLHLPASLRLGTLPQLAQGGPLPARPSVFNKPTAIVGEGNSNHPEYVIPTDPKYRGRAMSLWQAAGSKMQLMESGGILGGIKKLAGRVKNIAKDGLDLITNPAAVWDRLVKSIPMADQFRDSKWGTAIASMPPMILNRAREYALSFFKSFSDGFGGGNGDVVKAALKYIGVGDDRGMDNNNPFTRHFGWPAGTPWCALFASKAIEDARAGKRYPGAPTAAVATFNARMRHVPVGSGRPGDLATYGSNDHVNIIIKKAAGGYDTVGGNQGPRVNRYVRGGQATVLRPLASGGALSAEMREVFRQRNFDRNDARNPVLGSYRRMKKPQPIFDSGGFGVGWPFHSKKPEPVFNPQQWGMIQELIARGANGSRGPVVAGDLHLHDGVDIDMLSNRLDFQERARSF